MVQGYHRGTACQGPHRQGIWERGSLSSMAEQRSSVSLGAVLPHVPVLVAAAATIAAEVLAVPGPTDRDVAVGLLVLWAVALLIWPIWLVHTYLIAPHMDPDRPRPRVAWAVTPIVVTATVLILSGAGVPAGVP